jgi:hypothetical protein
MNEQLPPRPAREPDGKPPRIEYLAGPGEAGDSACWAQLVCPECGGMLSEGANHSHACPAAGEPSICG